MASFTIVIFNQMLDLEIGTTGKKRGPTVWDVENFHRLGRARRISTAGHCFGCTAGAGSSCTGRASLNSSLRPLRSSSAYSGLSPSLFFYS